MTPKGFLGESRRLFFFISNDILLKRWTTSSTYIMDTKQPKEQ